MEPGDLCVFVLIVLLSPLVIVVYLSICADHGAPVKRELHVYMVGKHAFEVLV